MPIDYIFATPGNVTTFVQQLAYFNSLTDVGYGGILGIIFLIVLDGIMFQMMKAFSVARAGAVTFFIGGIFAVMLRLMDLINNYILTISIILSILGVYLLIKESEKYET